MYDDVEMSLPFQLNLLFSLANAAFYEAGILSAVFLAARYAAIPIAVHVVYHSFTTNSFAKAFPKKHL